MNRLMAISKQEDLVHPRFGVVHQDEDLLVVNKPAGLVCHPTKAGEESSLIGQLRRQLGADAGIHMVHRLDRETSGVMVVARNGVAARELGMAWAEGAARKVYLAIVHGSVGPDTGRIEARLGRDDTSEIAIKDRVREDGAPARTEFRVERRFTWKGRPFSLLRVFPQSGRKHQIRIHLQHFGHSIVGDKIYGGDEGAYLAFVQGRLEESRRAALILPNHALHALEVRFEWRQEARIFQAPPGKDFSDFASGVDSDFFAREMI